MKHLYLDCQFGISGDMTLSALIDLGADMEYIKEQLRKLPIDPFTMDVKQMDKQGIFSKKLVLEFIEEEVEHNHFHPDIARHEPNNGHHHAYRSAKAILDMIKESQLPDRVKQRSLAVFEVIAQAEGKIHGIEPREVHFHEVGSMDSIIDVIGVSLALENLEIDRIIASPVPTGYGKFMMAHGLYPIPAPATAEILKEVPLLDFQVEGELTTPTGAGFLKALVNEYGHMPTLTMDRIGYGAGKRNFEHPNVLRAILFQTEDTLQTETMTILECQLDDITGEMLGYVMEKALEKGALDVYYTPIIMKKSRPGILISLLTKPEDTLIFEELLLRETSTFGLRKSQWRRKILTRRFQKVETPYGQLTVKIGCEGEQVYKIAPEYEDVKEVSIKNNIPLSEVYIAAHEAAKEQIK